MTVSPAWALAAAAVMLVFVALERVRSRRGPGDMRVDGQGRVSFDQAQGREAAFALRSAAILPACVLLELEHPEGRRRVAVTPASAGGDAYRRLCVRLRRATGRSAGDFDSPSSVRVA
jgi:hypothetical protein